MFCNGFLWDAAAYPPTVVFNTLVLSTFNEKLNGSGMFKIGTIEAGLLTGLMESLELLITFVLLYLFITWVWMLLPVRVLNALIIA
jgi:hypothetical protein